MKTGVHLRRLLALFFLSVSLSNYAIAQGAAASYPSKPIRFIVAFAQGGGTDILARIVALHLGKLVGQPIVVENRGGASGILAAAAVAKAPPDGYTLLVGGSSPNVFNPIVFETLPYDPLVDLAPITILGSYPIVIVARESLAAKSITELVKLAKEKPGTLNYGSASVAFQVPTEYFASRAGIKLQNIPYRGTSLAAAGLLAGDIDLVMADIAPAIGLLQSGGVRALAVTTAKRSSALPEVPTIAESGLLPDFDVSLFSSLSAPGGTPPEIVRKLQELVAKVLALPEVTERLRQFGVEAGGMSPEATAARFGREIELFGPIAREAGVRQTQ